MLLAGVDPAQVHEWYLSVYVDGFEWVEAPNTPGMSQYADGGLLGPKPYAASGAYIDRMSDYFRGCAYNPRIKTGPEACPLKPLYWHFMARHRVTLVRNARLATVYHTWDKMPEAARATVLSQGEATLCLLEQGAPI